MIEPEAARAPSLSLSATEPISFAWRRILEDPFVVLGGLVLAFIVSAAFGALLGGLTHPASREGSATVSTLAGLGNWVVSAFMAGGITRFCLRVARGERYGFGDIWSGGRTFLSILFTELLTAIAVGIGFIFLIVPGIVLALGLSMAIPLVVDRGLDPLTALRESWRLTYGHKWALLGYALLLALLALVGLVACGVGVLVVGAIAYLGQAYIYLQLIGENPRPPAGDMAIR